MELANQFVSGFHFLNCDRFRSFGENYASTLRIVRDVTAEYVSNYWKNIFQQCCFLKTAFFNII